MNRELKKYSNFCPVPWTQFASTTQGFQRTCCTMSLLKNELIDLGHSQQELDKCQNLEDGYFIFNNGKRLHVNDGIDSYINSDSTKNIKEMFTKNIAPYQCRCYYTEKLQPTSSRRIHYLNQYNLTTDEDVGKFLQNKDHGIDYYDIRLGNVCNLQCLMCHSSLSNQLYEEELYRSRSNSVVMDPGFEIKKVEGKIVYDKEKEKEIFDWANDEFFQKLEQQVTEDLEKNKNKIITFYMIGGEPLLNAPHFRFLERMVELGYSKNIGLEYNTNLTIVTDYIIDLWSKFKKVVLAISIDDIEDRYEYIRYPSKWSKIENNLSVISTAAKKYPEVFDGSVNIVAVINLFTAYKFSNLCKIEKIYGVPIHKLISTGPSHTTPVILTDEEKAQYIKLIDKDEHYNELVNYVNNFSYDQHARDEFFYMLKYWDSKRRKSFSVVFPELASVLKLI